MVTEGMPKVVARFSLRFTINLQNYESCKIEAGIELEGTIDNRRNFKNRHKMK